MSVVHSKPSMVHPSLYAAVKLARLVQRLKSRLGSLIKDCGPFVESCLPHPTKLKKYACKGGQGQVIPSSS